VGDEFLCNVLIIVGLLLVVCAGVIVPLAIFDSVERFAKELGKYFEGEDER
jgi:hypothetical protein